MLTLNECRKLVDPKKEKYTDKELEVMVSFLSKLMATMVVSGINYYELHLSEIIGATLIFWSCVFLLADLMGLEGVENGAGRGVLQPINHPHESK